MHELFVLIIEKMEFDVAILNSDDVGELIRVDICEGHDVARFLLEPDIHLVKT